MSYDPWDLLGMQLMGLLLLCVGLYELYRWHRRRWISKSLRVSLKHYRAIGFRSRDKS